MAPAETMPVNEAAKDLRPALKDISQRWWLMVLLVTAMLFCYAHRGAMGMAEPYVREDLGLNRAETGLILSAFFWLYALMQMPTGWLADRFGVRRTYAIGFAFWSLTTILTGLGKNLATLVLLRVSVGLGQSIAFPASARATANWFQERERGMVIGLYLAGVRYGTVLISLFGGWFLSRYDWRLFFVVIGATPLVWLLPWMFFLRKWEVKSKYETPAAPQPRSASFKESLLLLKTRGVLGIFLGFFAYNYVWNVFQAWLPSYLLSERNVSKAEMGVLSAMPYLAMSVIILISGALSDWLVRRGYDEKKVRKIFIVTGMLVGCLIVPAGMVEDNMTAIWLLTISLSGLGITSPNTWALTQAVSSKGIVGTVSGIQNTGGNIAAIFAPMLTGFIAHLTGSFALALGLCGVILVGGIIAYLLLVEDKVEIADEPAAA
ncbi:MAG: MFS transporter [Acidobacteria bacterium]|nr:MFS transporter [Acidobacteriota bacterium]